MKPKVIVDPAFRRMGEIFEAGDLARLRACCEVVWARDEPMPDADIERERGDAFAIVTGRWRHGALSEMPRLKAIMEVGGRHPSPASLDYGICQARGIRVLSCAPAFGPMVAEMALAMAIDAARELTAGHEAFRRGEEKYLWHGNEDAFTLYGETVGLVGFGGLANCLVPLLRPFDVRLLAHDPWRTDAYLRERGAEPRSLDDLLAEARVIFVLAIPSAENRALIGRRQLERIRADGVFVLMSRAHVVDFDALTDLLCEGRFRAAIDVFPEEPLPEHHRIRKAPNVVLSAHRAGSIAKDLRLIGRMVVDDLEALAAGLPPWRMQAAQIQIVQRLP